MQAGFGPEGTACQPLSRVYQLISDQERQMQRSIFLKTKFLDKCQISEIKLAIKTSLK